jgi:serine/threonine protein kinase
MKIMTNLDIHLNLVNLLGSCTAELASRKLWLLLEFCPHGDLKSFLISNRQQFKNSIQGKIFIRYIPGLLDSLSILMNHQRMFQNQLKAERTEKNGQKP